MASPMLECDHCGGCPMDGDTFFDGQGDACRECGFPGCISVQDDDDGSEPEAWWSASEADDAVCCDKACDECEMRRLEIRAETLTAAVKALAEALEVTLESGMQPSLERRARAALALPVVREVMGTGGQR